MAAKLKIHLDECRISYLFNTKNPINEESLEEKLIQKKYKINKDRIITRPPLQAVILNFARKGGIDIIYEKTKLPTFIGVIGTNHTLIVREFEGLQHILEESDEFIVQQSTGIEAVITCKIFGDVKPDNTLPHFARNEIKKFNEKFNKKFIIDNFTLVDTNTDMFTSIHLAPLHSDTRFFFMQLALKDSSLEKIFEFIENHEKYISDIIGIMGSND